MSTDLIVESLSTGYTHAPILHDLSVAVGSGEIVGLLGANGAGKTTLLRSAAGLLPAWSGSVRLGDRTLTKARSWTRVRAGLAHVPEGRHVFTAMSVADNLAVAALSRSAGPRFRPKDAYELFPRLAERRPQAAGSLSGGEQQMLAIARALVTCPHVVLVDEMSAGLAPVISQHLVEALAEIRRLGVGILLVEQSPHLIADVVDRVYLLEHGRVAGEGTFADLGGLEAVADLYLGVGASQETGPPHPPGNARRPSMT